MKFLKHILIVALVVLNSDFIKAGINIISPRHSFVHYTNGYIYCDSSNTKTIDSIIELSNSNSFVPYTIQNAQMQKAYTYWIRLNVIDTVPGSNLVLFANHKADLFQVYIPRDSDYISYQTGLNVAYSDWPLQYFSTALPLPIFYPNKPIFLKVKSSLTSGFGILVYDLNEQLNTSVKSTLLRGIFLGFCLIIFLYTLIFYIFIRDRAYLYYSLYVICFAVFGLVSWYLIVPILTFFRLGWHDFYYTIPYAGMTVFLLLYTRSFLETKKQLFILSKILLYAAIIRIILLLLGLLVNSTILYNPNIDNLLLLPAWIAGIMSWRKGYRPARYITLGFSILYLGLLEHSLHYISLLPASFKLFSLFNSGVTEIIFFSLALADRFRILKNENERAIHKTLELQEKNIIQLKENEQLREKVNRELEEKVNDRTRELQVANDAIRAMNEILNKHNINLESDIKDIAHKRVNDQTVSFDEFQRIYPDEDSCYKMIEELKWGHGFFCTRCSNSKYSKANTPYSRRCSKCNHIERITSNTLFSRVKIPINKAFYMLFLTYSGKNLSILELSEMLDIRRQTCWAFKKKMDEAIELIPASVRQHAKWTDLILAVNREDE